MLTQRSCVTMDGARTVKYQQPRFAEELLKNRQTEGNIRKIGSNYGDATDVCESTLGKHN